MTTLVAAHNVHTNLWPCGTWCFPEDSWEFSYLSGNYEKVGLALKDDDDINDIVDKLIAQGR